MAYPDRPLSYLPLIQRQCEQLNIKKLGTALFIVRLDTQKIWTVTEREAKTSTGREAGVVTIPLETRTVEEPVAGNIMGALAEFRPLQPDEELDYLTGESYMGRRPFITGAAVDVVALGLKNPKDDNGLQTLTEEVAANGWRSIDELLSERDKLRRGLPELLESIQGEGRIEKFADRLRTADPKNIITCNPVELNRYLERRKQMADYGP